MVILRVVLNTAGIWWFVGGLILLNAIAPSLRETWLLFALTIIWMIGIIPSVVLSAQSSRCPISDIRAAWYALKQYCLILGLIFGAGSVIALMFALSRI